MIMVSVTIKNGKVEFESYDEYIKWDTERARQEKEEKERKEKEESERRKKILESLTEEEKEKIDKLEEKIFLIQMADFLSQEDWNNIWEYRRQIKEIRGF